MKKQIITVTPSEIISLKNKVDVRSNPLLTEDTRRSFNGPIYYVQIPYGVKIGPFYRLDEGEMVEERLTNGENFPRSNLTINEDHLLESRCKRLINFIEKLDSNRVIKEEKQIALKFIQDNKKSIEMDADFSLLPTFEMLFLNICVKEEIEEISKIWHKLSPGRWCGPERGNDFFDWHDKYYLVHYFPDKQTNEKEFFCFKFYFLNNFKDLKKNRAYFLEKLTGEVSFNLNTILMQLTAFVIYVALAMSQ